MSPGAKRGRANTPDDALFIYARGAWRLRPEVYTFAPGSAQALRAAVAAAPGADVEEVARLPGDLLCAAAAAPPAAMLDLLDGSLVPSVCLCCDRAASAAAARAAAEPLRALLRYYDPASYCASRAYPRAVAVLARDLTCAELAETKRAILALAETPAAVAEVNAHPGLCVAAPPCAPGTLWVYSTPDGRRLLRHLARHGGRAVRVTVASSAGAAARHRYRMYAVADAEAPPAGAATLLERVEAWVRKNSAPSATATTATSGGAATATAPSATATSATATSASAPSAKNADTH